VVGFQITVNVGALMQIFHGALTNCAMKMDHILPPMRIGQLSSIRIINRDIALYLALSRDSRGTLSQIYLFRLLGHQIIARTVHLLAQPERFLTWI